MTIFSELIGTALLHFIWQGALVALILALVLFVLKNAPSQIRYGVSWVALIIMVALPAQSILKEYRALQAEQEYAQHVVPEVDARVFVDAGDNTTEAATSSVSGETVGSELPVQEAAEENIALARLSSMKPYLTAFWVVGVFIMSIRLFGGWFVVSRLRTMDSEPVGEELQALFDRLVEQAGIRGEVLVRQTKTCTEVLLIGWIKPAVLLPLSVVSEMSTDHLEAIIAHELAHVKRYDYILAGVQAVIETLLFFHPAVWWVSRQVRVEREHCCDDLAVEIIKDRARYARALYELEVNRNNFLRFALSANDGSLLSRINRLASASPAGKNGYMRTGLSSGLVALVLGMSLVVGSCADLSVDTENPVTVGAEFKIPAALESLVSLDDRDGVVEYVHNVRDEGSIEEALEMTLGAYAKADEELRRSLMFVIAHINTLEGDEALLSIAETDPSVEVRHAAIRGINIRILDEPEMGNESVRGVNTPPGSEYKYQAISLEREQALTSALQHIAQDNEQDSKVRREAVVALSHREDMGDFFVELIAASIDDYFTLQTMSHLKLEKQYVPELMRMHQNQVDGDIRGRALGLLGTAGALEAMPLMLESVVVQGAWIDRRAMDDPNSKFAYSPAWPLSNLYRALDPGGQQEMVTLLKSEIIASLEHDEQATRNGFASESEKKETIARLYRLRNMLMNLGINIYHASERKNAAHASELRMLEDRTTRLLKTLNPNYIPVR